MMRRRDAPPDLTPEVRDAVVSFLRDWLPDEAKRVYREMIREDAAGWMDDPHFQGGFIMRYALRGNGLDERALNVRDLEPLWPDLLRSAVFGAADTRRALRDCDSAAGPEPPLRAPPPPGTSASPPAHDPRRAPRS
jgi:hypothetical protein